MNTDKSKTKFSVQACNELLGKVIPSEFNLEEQTMAALYLVGTQGMKIEEALLGTVCDCYVKMRLW